MRRFPHIGGIRSESAAFRRADRARHRSRENCGRLHLDEGRCGSAEGDYLLFSDVPANKMYRWSEADGVSVFLDPSGYDGPGPIQLSRAWARTGLIPRPRQTAY
jgi:gluconolactonase